MVLAATTLRQDKKTMLPPDAVDIAELFINILCFPER